MAVKNILDGHPDGSTIGAGVTEKLAFYGYTPIVQRASASQAAFTPSTLTAVATTTLSAAYTGMWAFASSTVGKSVTTQLNKVITDLPKLETLVLRLRADLVAYGLTKGAA